MTGVHTMPRVLIIEDHVANLELAIGIPESEGYQVLTAETAEQAWSSQQPSGRISF